MPRPYNYPGGIGVNEPEPSVFDARQFFAQVRAPGLDLPERVDDPEIEDCKMKGDVLTWQEATI
jgi:hypothetical protein